MAKFNRQIDQAGLSDPSSIDSITYNYPSGGNKNMSVGPHLLPIPAGATWITDVSTVTGLPAMGLNLAVYNKSGTVASLTIGNSPSLASLALGVVDASGNVGVACPPNAWTYLSTGANQWIISSSNNLVVYIIEDFTYITREN